MLKSESPVILETQPTRQWFEILKAPAKKHPHFKNPHTATLRQSHIKQQYYCNEKLQNIEAVNYMDNAKYFYRNIMFTRKNNQISLVDINQPDSVTSLDDWLGIVVSLADGRHTIQQLIDYMSQQYQEAPAGLEKTLHSVIERLEEGKIIQLSKSAVSLPYYLSLPLEELDIEKAKKLIQEDGYNSASSNLH